MTIEQCETYLRERASIYSLEVSEFCTTLADDGGWQVGWFLSAPYTGGGFMTFVNAFTVDPNNRATYIDKALEDLLETVVTGLDRVYQYGREAR